jgi:hypothetical protein
MLNKNLPFSLEVWSVDQFLSVPVFEKNRNVERRIKSLTKKLSTNTNERLKEVSVGVATQDFDKSVSRYKRGDMFCLDGNCRAEIWRNNPSLCPENVYVKVYPIMSKTHADETYETFDNVQASENSSDKLSGVLREKNYIGISQTVKYGLMNTFLKKATLYVQNENGEYLRNKTTGEMFDFHLNEVSYLDKHQRIFSVKKGSCNIYTSLLMIGKKYGTDHPRYKLLIDNFCDEISETNDKENVDGVTYVFNTLYGEYKEIWKNNARGVNHSSPLFGKILFSFESFILGDTINKHSKATKNTKNLKNNIFIEYYKDFYQS